MTVTVVVEPPVCPECAGPPTAVDLDLTLMMQLQPTPQVYVFEFSGFHNFSLDLVTLPPTTRARCAHDHEWAVALTARQGRG